MNVERRRVGRAIRRRRRLQAALSRIAGYQVLPWQAAWFDAVMRPLTKGEHRG